MARRKRRRKTSSRKRRKKTSSRRRRKTTVRRIAKATKRRVKHTVSQLKKMLARAQKEVSRNRKIPKNLYMNIAKKAGELRRAEEPSGKFFGRPY